MPALTLLLLSHAFPQLRLGPRRHAEQEHLAQRPDMICESCRQRRRLRPPLLGRGRPVGGLRREQRLASGSVWEAKVVVDVNNAHCGRKPASPWHSVATRRPTAATCWRMLRCTRSTSEVLLCQPSGTEHLMAGLHRAKDHAVFDLDQASPPRPLEPLCIEPRRQRHPARLRAWAFGLPTRRLHPRPLVREQGRGILAQAVGQKERRTVGRQHLRDVVDDTLCHGQGAVAAVARHQQLGHGGERYPDPVG